jgi:hypothetical protein
MVLAMEEGGETYTWNEFYLVGTGGGTATLVHEEGEHGPEWRLFRLLEPAPAITAAEAQGHRVGQWINLTGNRLRVTCVDESRVIYLEGEAPEGVELGDVAHYFNAESGNQMIVVSWTGEEVEVFQGVQLPGYAVYRAFGLQPPSPKAGGEIRRGGWTGASVAHDVSDSGSEGPGKVLAVLRSLVMLGGFAFVGLPILRALWGMAFSSGPGPQTISAPSAVVIGPPKVELAIGAGGELDGVPHGIAGRGVTEIARVGRRQGRQEYVVTNQAGATSILVQSASGRTDQWFWLRPIEPSEPLRPVQAGAQRLGDRVPMGAGAEAASAQVVDLFLSRSRGGEGEPSIPSGAELYGFEAKSGDQRYVARWNESTITYYRLSPASAADVAVFKPK